MQKMVYGFMMLNATFNNISVTSWRWVLLVEEIGVPGENHRHVAIHWQTLSYIITWLLFSMHMIGLKLNERFWVLAISPSRLKIDSGRCPESDITFARYTNILSNSFFRCSITNEIALSISVFGLMINKRSKITIFYWYDNEFVSR